MQYFVVNVPSGTKNMNSPNDFLKNPNLDIGKLAEFLKIPVYILRHAAESDFLVKMAELNNKMSGDPSFLERFLKVSKDVSAKLENDCVKTDVESSQNTVRDFINFCHRESTLVKCEVSEEILCENIGINVADLDNILTKDVKDKIEAFWLQNNVDAELLNEVNAILCKYSINKVSFCEKIGIDVKDADINHLVCLLTKDVRIKIYEFLEKTEDKAFLNEFLEIELSDELQSDKFYFRQIKKLQQMGLDHAEIRDLLNNIIKEQTITHSNISYWLNNASAIQIKTRGKMLKCFRNDSKIREKATKILQDKQKVKNYHKELLTQLGEHIKSNGLFRKDIAKIFGIESSSLSHKLNGRHAIEADDAEKIRIYLEKVGVRQTEIEEDTEKSEIALQQSRDTEEKVINKTFKGNSLEIELSDELQNDKFYIEQIKKLLASGVKQKQIVDLIIKAVGANTINQPIVSKIVNGEMEELTQEMRDSLKKMFSDGVNMLEITKLDQIQNVFQEIFSADLDNPLEFELSDDLQSITTQIINEGKNMDDYLVELLTQLYKYIDENKLVECNVVKEIGIYGLSSLPGSIMVNTKNIEKIQIYLEKVGSRKNEEAKERNIEEVQVHDEIVEKCEAKIELPFEQNELFLKKLDALRVFMKSNAETFHVVSGKTNIDVNNLQSFVYSDNFQFYEDDVRKVGNFLCKIDENNFGEELRDILGIEVKVKSTKVSVKKSSRKIKEPKSVRVSSSDLQINNEKKIGKSGSETPNRLSSKNIGIEKPAKKSPEDETNEFFRKKECLRKLLMGDYKSWNNLSRKTKINLMILQDFIYGGSDFEFADPAHEETMKKFILSVGDDFECGFSDSLDIEVKKPEVESSDEKKSMVKKSQNISSELSAFFGEFKDRTSKGNIKKMKIIIKNCSDISVVEGLVKSAIGKFGGLKISYLDENRKRSGLYIYEYKMVLRMVRIGIDDFSFESV